MTRHMKRGGKVWIRIFPDKPITKKPAETRMGTGKGGVEYYVAVVKPGRILYEMEGMTEELATSALKLAAGQAAGAHPDRAAAAMRSSRCKAPGERTWRPPKELNELSRRGPEPARGRAARDAVPGPAQAADRARWTPVRADQAPPRPGARSSPCSRRRSGREDGGARPRGAGKSRNTGRRRDARWPSRRQSTPQPSPRPSQDPHRHRHLEQDAEDGGRHRRSAARRTPVRQDHDACARSTRRTSRTTTTRRSHHQRGRPGAHRRDAARLEGQALAGGRGREAASSAGRPALEPSRSAEA